VRTGDMSESACLCATKLERFLRLAREVHAPERIVTASLSKSAEVAWRSRMAGEISVTPTCSSSASERAL